MQRFVPLLLVLVTACSEQTMPVPDAAGALGGIEKTWPASESPAPGQALPPASPPTPTTEPTSLPPFSPRRALRIISEHVERQTQVTQKITS